MSDRTRGPRDPAERRIYERGRRAGMYIGGGMITLILIILIIVLLA